MEMGKTAMQSDPQAEARAFLVDLGELLHSHGAPAMRLEEALTLCAGRLGMRGQFLSTPTSLLFGFGEGADQRMHLTRIEPGDVDIGRLADLDAVIEGITTGRLGATEGHELLRGMQVARRRYSRPVTTLAFALAAGTAACFFGGGLVDVGLSALTGLLIGALAVAIGGRRRAALVFETVAAALASIIGLGAASIWPGTSAEIITLSALIVLVPGLTLTVAMNELASRHLVAGTARLAWAAMIFLSIGLGVGSGRALARFLPAAPEALVTEPLPTWALALALLLAPMAFAVLFRARRRDIPWVLLAGWIGFAGARVGAALLGANLGVLVGALLVGLSSNSFARLKRLPASIMQVPGIMLLVPGSLGFHSLQSFLTDDVLTGMESAFDMAQVAGALVGGLLFANALLRPHRSL